MELKTFYFLFDNTCAFCTNYMEFLKARNFSGKFIFLPLQSKDARRILRSHGVLFVNLKTVYFINNNKVYKRSSAILRTMKALNYPYKAFCILLVIPPFIRNYAYNLIAKKRHWLSKL